LHLKWSLTKSAKSLVEYYLLGKNNSKG